MYVSRSGAIQGCLGSRGTGSDVRMQPPYHWNLLALELHPSQTGAPRGGRDGRHLPGDEASRPRYVPLFG